MNKLRNSGDLISLRRYGDLQGLKIRIQAEIAVGKKSILVFITYK